MSSVTYLIRNLRKTAPLMGVIMLAVMLVNGIIVLIDSIPLSVRTIYSYSKESLAVTPRGDPEQTAKLVSIIRSESPVPIERVVLFRGSPSQVQSIVGRWPFLVFGFTQDDMDYFLKRQHTASITGRKPRAGEPEAIISRVVARNQHLEVGSTLLSPTNNDNYSPKEVKVVGIAETDRWFMIDSYEYQQANHFPPIDVALIFAKNRHDQEILDAWATERLKGVRAQLFSYAEIEKESQTMFGTLFAILNVVIGLIVGVITLMVSMLINIYQSERLLEYGLLQALGYTKRQLLWRSIRELLIVVAIGYVLGLILANGMLSITDTALMAPKAFALNKYDLLALQYTFPVPIAILAAAIFTVLRRFRGFDPVGVVERRLV